ncbi:sorbitol dehydrogenase family protein [Asaia krungthepensis]|nr:sorbitol dehydrogenase family protein [Asaia krungthepensis]
MVNTTRRGFLGCGVAALPFLAFPALTRAASEARSDALSEALPGAGACPPDFHAVSMALTGHEDLDEALVPRVWVALLARHPEFPARYRLLAEAMRQRGIHRSQDYAASGLRAEKALHEVSVEIVAAWYLGRVGPMLPRSEAGTPAFITYEGAMMWRPTSDVTVLPTYARGGPGFWAQPPLSLETD